MKQLIIIATLFLSSLTFAQEIKVTNESVTFNNGSHPAVVVTIPYAKKELVEKASNFAKYKKEMSVEEMKQFFHQTLLTMADTFERATGDTRITGDMRDFCYYFAERMNLLEK